MPLSSHISNSQNHRKLWHTSLVMAPEGFLFYSSMKRGRSGHWNERAVIGHFQKVRLVGTLAPDCLVCCQTLDSLIRNLINQLRQVSAWISDGTSG